MSQLRCLADCGGYLDPVLDPMNGIHHNSDAVEFKCDMCGEVYHQSELFCDLCGLPLLSDGTCDCEDDYEYDFYQEFDFDDGD